jgi:Spy/CpxP family protein refolding chaperone
MKKWLAGFIAIAVVAGATGVFAFGPGGCGGCPERGFGSGDGPGAFGRLNLSKEQYDKMWQLRTKFQDETKDLRYQIQQKRLGMRSLFADPKADDGAIRAQFAEMNDLRRKLQEKRLEFRLAQRKILTPDQIQELGEEPSGRGFGRGGMCRGGAGADPASYKAGPGRAF